MRETPPPSPAIVVGIDGSPAAIAASLWAAQEAAARDVPVRLVYAIESTEPVPVDQQTLLQEFGTAECAIRQAVTAVESVTEPVKVEAEIVRAATVPALLQASRSAVMICIGAMRQSAVRRASAGTTAADLTARARCPVAIIREAHSPDRNSPQWIIAADNQAASGLLVLGSALEEARLRSAPVRIISTGRASSTSPHRTESGESDPEAARWRMLNRWRAMHPEMTIDTVTADLWQFVAEHADEIQLVVMDKDHRSGNRAFDLAAADCSLLVTAPYRAL